MYLQFSDSIDLREWEESQKHRLTQNVWFLLCSWWNLLCQLLIPNFPVFHFNHGWNCVCLLLDTHSSSTGEKLSLGEETLFCFLENLFLPLDHLPGLLWEHYWLVVIKVVLTGYFLICLILCYHGICHPKQDTYENERGSVIIKVGECGEPRLS